MNIKENFKNVWEKLKSLDEKTLVMYQNSIFFIVVGDLIGIYYLLGLKTLGIAILIASLVALALILWLIRGLPEEKIIKRRKPKKMKQKEEKIEESEEDEEEVEEESAVDFSLGLPNIEDYNRRAAVALGSL